MDPFWRAVLQPLGTLILVGIPAALITVAVRRWMPDNKLRRALLDREFSRRHPWFGVLAFIGCFALFWLIAELAT